MSEQMTETPTTPTEGQTSSEAVAQTLLSSSEPVATTEQQGEPLKEGEAAAAEGIKTEETKAPEGAPESYDFKAPEGVTYDSAVLDSFAGAAKEANLTQDAAQKLLESMAPSLATRQAEQIKSVQDGWRTASSTDAEFGGDKLQENLATAKKALTAYGNPGLSKLLDDSGLGNHPEMIRMLVKVGKSVSGDTFVAGASAADHSKRMVDVMYDNSPGGAK